MLKQERQDKIMELLKEKGAVTVNELCDLLNTSKPTIRRDLVSLDKKNTVKKTYGGALLIKKKGTEDLPIDFRRSMNKEEKASIAHTALEYISEGDTIFLDSGSTTFALATLIKKFVNLTVLTNDIDIAIEVSRNTDNQLIIVGGFLKKTTTALTGFFAEQMIADIRVNTAFLAADAVDLESGFMGHYMDEIPIKRIMIKNSKKSIILCDHTKFENAALIGICTIDSVDKVITNQEINQHTLQKLLEAGANIQTV